MIFVLNKVVLVALELLQFHFNWIEVVCKVMITVLVDVTKMRIYILSRLFGNIVYG